MSASPVSPILRKDVPDVPLVIRTTALPPLFSICSSSLGLVVPIPTLPAVLIRIRSPLSPSPPKV